MGSDRIIDDVTADGHPLLSRDAAGQLLASITTEAMCRIEHVSNTNDVFRILTGSGNRFYIKFHTSPWYKDAEDTAVVVRREYLGARLLKDRGIRLDYTSWMDCTRTVVGRSVLILSELPGEPLPRLLQQHPSKAAELLPAFAGYLGQVHSIAFPVAGYLEFCGDDSIPPDWIPEKQTWWNSHACQTAANLMALAIETLSNANSIPGTLAAEIKRQFAASEDALAAEYRQPAFVINNLHPFHFHLSRTEGSWQVVGFYDLEVTSSGNPTTDVALCDLQLTPLLGRLGWRTEFLSAYGRPLGIHTYKTLLITHLLMALRRAPTHTIPDPAWLIDRLPALAAASSIGELGWYPK